MTALFKRLLALVLIVTLQLGWLTPVHATESTGTVVSQSFTGTTAEIINPERSWYSWAGSQYCPGNASSMAAARSAGYSMVLCILDLSGYISNATLGSDVTTAVTNAATYARASGVKLVIRPAYNYNDAGCDASLAIVLQHITQLKQVMRDNADVIAYAQSGFFGPYGEQWAGTCSVSRSDADRSTLMDALLAAWHPRTLIGMRYPAHINAKFPNAMTAALMATGAAQGRIAYYQDCIFADPTDGGTYTSLTDSKRARVAADTNYLPFGGETCNSTQNNARTACSDILSEGPKYHFAYLNRSYDTGYYNNWTSQGCYAQVMRSMGYRFVLDSVSHQSTANIGQTITAFVYMHNEGWARIFSPRRVVVQLRNSSGTVVASGTSYYDLRLLPPQSTTQQQIPVQLTVPSGGTLNLEICMPDRWPSLATDGRFSVRPANANSPGSWNSTNACFVTGTTVVAS